MKHNATHFDDDHVGGSIYTARGKPRKQNIVGAECCSKQGSSWKLTVKGGNCNIRNTGWKVEGGESLENYFSALFSNSFFTVVRTTCVWDPMRLPAPGVYPTQDVFGTHEGGGLTYRCYTITFTRTQRDWLDRSHLIGRKLGFMSCKWEVPIGRTKCDTSFVHTFGWLVVVSSVSVADSQWLCQ